jgi:hypothetical protein
VVLANKDIIIYDKEVVRSYSRNSSLNFLYEWIPKKEIERLDLFGDYVIAYSFQTSDLFRWNFIQGIEYSAIKVDIAL